MPTYKIRIMVAKSVDGSNKTETIICFKDKNNVKAAYEDAVQLCDEVFPSNGMPTSKYITTEEIPS